MKRGMMLVFAIIGCISLAGQALALTPEEAQLNQMKYYLYQAGQQLLQAQAQIEQAKKQGADVSYAIQQFTEAKEAYDQAVVNAQDAEAKYEFGEYDSFTSFAVNATAQALITISAAGELSDDVKVQVQQKIAESGNWTQKLDALELEINATQKKYDQLNQSVNQTRKQEGLNYLNQSRYYLSQARFYNGKQDEYNTNKEYTLSLGSLKQSQAILEELLETRGMPVPVFVHKGAARKVETKPEIIPPAGNVTGPSPTPQDNTPLLLSLAGVLGLITLIIIAGVIRAKLGRKKPGKTKTLYQVLLEQEKKKK